MPWPADLARRLWRELPVYIFSAVCGLIVLALWRAHGLGYDPEQTSISYDIFKVCAVAMVFVDLLWSLARHRPAKPAEFLRRRYLTPQAGIRLLAALPVLALCTVLIPIFSSLKSMIPLFANYSWDAPLIRWERALLLGHDAWQVLQPLIGYPAVTATLAAIYHVWTALLYPGIIFFAIYPAVSPDLKRRFFLAYAMAWALVGGLLATLLASVGPVFAEQLAGIADFRPQMDYLHAANAQIPVLTVPVQDMLLARFESADSSLGSGISAMPSMHVAIAALYWLAMREVSPRAGRFFLGFMVVIWIGSVHLAYHYALDGLVSLVVMAAIWRLVAIIFAAWDRLPVPFAQPALRTNTVPAE